MKSVPRRAALVRAAGLAISVALALVLTGGLRTSVPTAEAIGTPQNFTITQFPPPGPLIEGNGQPQTVQYQVSYTQSATAGAANLILQITLDEAKLTNIAVFAGRTTPPCVIVDNNNPATVTVTCTYGAVPAGQNVSLVLSATVITFCNQPLNPPGFGAVPLTRALDGLGDGAPMTATTIGTPVPVRCIGSGNLFTAAGSITPADPTFSRPAGPLFGPSVLGRGCTTVAPILSNYDAYTYVHAGGPARISVNGLGSGGGTLFDAVMQIYVGSFNPANGCQNLLLANDDGGVLFNSSYYFPYLAPGTYVIVASNLIGLGFGTYTVTVSSQ